MRLVQDNVELERAYGIEITFFLGWVFMRSAFFDSLNNDWFFLRRVGILTVAYP